MEDAGTFRLLEDEEGQRYWSGKCPGDKEGTDFAPGEPLILNPAHWNVGTVISAEEPEPRLDNHHVGLVQILEQAQGK